MKQLSSLCSILLSLMILTGLVSTVVAQKESKNSKFYRFSGLPIFHPHPHPHKTVKKPWNIKNLGPVGIGIDLTGTHFTMVIKNVEPGSPAAKTKQLKKGQIIESINGKVLKDIDPRIILGNIVSEAEATDGLVNLKIKGKGIVTVRIPVMGSYSKTWPLNCKKSDKVVRKLADKLATLKEPGWGATLFLLSTGEEKDLAVVRRWMKNLDSIGSYQWHYGFMGIGVCEYYLRTGDKSVLPAIHKMAKRLKETMYIGGWSGRGNPARFTYSTGSGQLHAAGVHCLTSLLLARMCGVEVDEYTLQESLTQFYRFAGHGNVAYGNGIPEGGYVDNGKTSGLGLAMAAAALLTPNGESSVYAKARDTCSTKSFYATNWFHAAHTGGGIGEIWHHAGMSMMHKKRPAQYRSYLDTRRWVMDLSRRYDGTIGIAGMTDRYDESATEGNIGWGTFFALTYTLPRQHLQLFGAPRSKWAKYHQLPERPWGTPEDDFFLENDPIPSADSFSKDLLLKENVLEHSSYPTMLKLNKPSAPDSLFTHYFHHPEFAMRVMALRAAIGHRRHHFIIPFLKSSDPRMRHLGILSLTGMFKGGFIPDGKVTPEMLDLVGKMVENPDESWWVVQDAIHALRRGSNDTVVKHRDRLIELLDSKSIWIQQASLMTLTKISMEPKHYKELLPIIFNKAVSLKVDAASSMVSHAIKTALKKANPQVKKFAMPLLQKAYLSVPEELVAKHGAVFDHGANTIRLRVTETISQLPGGGQFVLQLPKTTLASTRSGRSSDMYSYGEFKMNKQALGRWLNLGKVWQHPVTDTQLAKFVENGLKKDQASKSKAKAGKGRYRPQYLTLADKGKGSRFWSDDMIILHELGEAVKMDIRTIKGRKCMLVEIGNFPDKAPKNWHCSYNLYVFERDIKKSSSKAK